MKKSKQQQVLEFSPGRDGNGMLDEFARQMNGIALGLAARSRERDRPRQPTTEERSRPRHG
jgi:hypothetical protein